MKKYALFLFGLGLLVFSFQASSVGAQEVPTFSKGMVSLTFDDGWKNIYTYGKPILDAAGIKSTQYVYTAPVACRTEFGLPYCEEFMTKSDVIDFHNSGHEVAAHTRSHVSLPTVTTLNDLLFESYGSRLDLLADIGVPVSNLAYPFGELSPGVIDQLKRAGYSGARTVYPDALNSPITDKYSLYASQVNANTTLEQVQGWVEQAIAEKGWLILVFHQITDACVAPTGIVTPTEVDAYCSSPAGLQAIVDYLVSLGDSISLPTVGQGLALMDTAPVSDGVAPEVVQTDIVVPASSEAGAAVAFDPVVSDSDANLFGTLGTFCTTLPLVEHPIFGIQYPTVVTSGHVFPIGETSVECKAADSGGNVATHTFKVTVNNAPQTIALTIEEKTYGDPDFDLVATSTSGAAVTFAVSSGPAELIDADTVHITGAGVVKIKATVPASGFYASSEKEFEFTVKPLAIEVVADEGQTKKIGSADPTNFTFTSDPLVGTDVFTGKLERDPGEGLGGYQIRIGTLTAGDNYEITFISKNFEILPESTSGGGGGGVVVVQSSGGSTSGGGGGVAQVLDEQVQAHPSGTLVLHEGTIYLIKNGQRFGFRNPQEFFSHGYTFVQAVPANAADMSLPFEETNIIKALPGTLVLDAGDGKTVFMIGPDYTKRGFDSEEAFTKLGYNYGQMVTIDVSDYESQSPITTNDETHPEGALVLDQGTVWWIQNGQKQGFESETVFNTYGFNFTRVVPATVADSALPTGSLVKLRDGTLVNNNSNLFIVSDAKARKFRSLISFQNLGYSVSNAVSLDLVNYESGTEI